MPDWYGKGKDENDSLDAKRKKLPFQSRRSPILCRNGCVATSQPLASTIGLNILQSGGNAADASIAIAAALAVLEPCSTGLGGDMFALVYDAKEKAVRAVNGSGRSANELTLEYVEEWASSLVGPDGDIKEAFTSSAHAVTVPGAASGWEAMYEKFGSGVLSFYELLEPAAMLAEEGFPVAPVTAQYWKSAFYQLSRWVDGDDEVSNIELSIDGKAPEAGEIFQNLGMARVLRDLGKLGSKKGFYEGFTGERIVAAVRRNGGLMTLDDLANHETTFPDPVCVDYREKKLWQVPPNGQGIAGLIALRGLAALEKSGKVSSVSDEDSFQSFSCIHSLIEMMRLGFSDAKAFVADENDMTVTSDWLLDDRRISERAHDLFNPQKAVIAGSPDTSSGTVSFQVVDKDGNAVSFVNSNFMGFGTGIIAEDCGFTLQNRGAGFSLEKGHPNQIQPNKRPYHTIIPGMITFNDEENDLYATISNMGGFMQPQGHLQLTVSMVGCGLDPQRAIDLPRFCIPDGTKTGAVFVEDGVDGRTLEKLRVLGHNIVGPVSGYDRSVFGKAQIIYKDRSTGVLWAGSDGRGDGCAIGY